MGRANEIGPWQSSTHNAKPIISALRGQRVKANMNGGEWRMGSDDYIA